MADEGFEDSHNVPVRPPGGDSVISGLFKTSSVKFINVHFACVCMKRSKG